jgi:phosphoribosyl 1,2-cyclic phosphate phosphodiesterase
MRYGRSNPLPGFASTATVSRLRARFDYIFEGQHGYPTLCELKPLAMRLVAGFALDWVEMPHGPTASTGLRFEADGKALVYATDFSAITEDMVRCFLGADLLVCDCLRREPHPTHAHLAMALELKARTKARRMILTHLDKSMDYRTLSVELPKNVAAGFDGLEWRG